MKRLFLYFAVAFATLTATAQQFVVINGQPILAEDIERIAYQNDEEFMPMPKMLASDPKTQLFSQALQLTGLADSLVSYYDYDYNGLDYEYLDGLYPRVNHTVYVKMLRRRYIKYTAFVETDEVLAAHGISTFDALKAYAKKVYDEVYPEDAGITDPTDRRHSLNRFVAYHFLPLGATRETLTAYPNFFDQSIADVADWYRTLMPCGSLKVSRPRTDNDPVSEIGLFLNRRGVQNGPDKYGVQTRGILIGESVPTANGEYFYIDDLLTYDKKTQTETLQERWRVDFVTLSPDFMNAQTRLMKGEYYNTNDATHPTVGFVNKYTSGIQWNDDTDLFIEPARYYYWNYGGDEVDMRSDNGYLDLTIDLPPLPEGDWELRFGTVMIPTNPVLRFCIDDELLCDTVDFSNSNAPANYYGWINKNTMSQELLADLVKYRAQIDELILTIPKRIHYPNGIQYKKMHSWDEGEYVDYYGNTIPEEVLKIIGTSYISVEDIDQLINEKVLVAIDETHTKDMLTGITYEEGETMPTYENLFCLELFRLNGWMYGPIEYRSTVASGNNPFWTTSNSTPFVLIPSLSRRIIGRFHSDGKTNHKLRMTSLYSSGGCELDLDYLEFCPVSIADHPSILED